jgi:hypothetical protein
MIDLGTLAGLHECQHELHAYCRTCDRWQAIDLARLVASGLGARRLPVRVRCSVCGVPGQLQVRPPMPARSSSGWIAPPVLSVLAAPATNRVVDAPRSV